MNETPEAEPEASATTAGRRRALMAGAIAIVAVLVVAGLVVATRSDDATSAPGDSQSSSSASAPEPIDRSTPPKDRNATTVVTRPDGSPAPTLPNGSPAPTLPNGSPAPTLPNGSPAPTRPDGSPAPTNASGGTVGPTIVAPGQTLPPVTAPPTVRQAYLAAYDGKCASIWSIAGRDGLLWDVEDASNGPFRVQDCRDLKDADEADFYETIEDARFAGADDAVFNLQMELVGYELRNTDGSRIWSE